MVFPWLVNGGGPNHLLSRMNPPSSREWDLDLSPKISGT